MLNLEIFYAHNKWNVDMFIVSATVMGRLLPSNFSDRSIQKDCKKLYKGLISFGYHATVCMPGFTPNHGL